MNPRQTKVIGILGGMGPEATIDLFTKIVHSTPASKDQDHLRIIIDNNPAIPDRQEALLHNGPSPVPLIIETAKNLESAGADFIVIPCNTAHYWIDQVREAVRIPIVDMIGETAEELARSYPSARTVGLLAASGTVKSGLYQRHLLKKGIRTICPSSMDQDELMHAIYGVKGGDASGPSVAVTQIAQKLIADGAEALIAGCTEIPLVIKAGDLAAPIIDATLVLARRAVEIALGSSAL
jgi:aspartate racemase